MKKIVVLILAIGVVGLMGMTGCKNSCQKAIDHMKGCMEDYCKAHENSPACSEEALAEMTDAGAEVECTDENKAQAEAMLQVSCEQLTAGFALLEGMQDALQNAPTTPTP